MTFATPSAMVKVPAKLLAMAAASQALARISQDGFGRAGIHHLPSGSPLKASKCSETPGLTCCIIKWLPLRNATGGHPTENTTA
jgi:hypothetical protein